MQNQKIRDAMKLHGVKQWELAKALGIGETTLCRKLRFELSPEDQTMIRSTIETMAKTKKE